VKIAYALSALAGLGPGEAIALEWDAVDLEAEPSWFDARSASRAVDARPIRAC
jgi:hypothetical protein